MVDGRVDEYNGAFFAYFPDKVSVHPGDRDHLPQHLQR